jgi:hypothetical protein
MFDSLASVAWHSGPLTICPPIPQIPSIPSPKSLPTPDNKGVLNLHYSSQNQKIGHGKNQITDFVATQRHPSGHGPRLP